MKLRTNHSYRYAVEQMVMTLFPDAHIDGQEPALCSTLHYAPRWVTARAALDWGGSRAVKSRRVPRAALTDKIQTDRLLQQAIKLSVYGAATQALGLAAPNGDAAPPWGALTGVRPAKLALRLMHTHGEQGALRALQSTYFVQPRRAALAVACARTSMAVSAALAPQDIGLYIGIPFCPTRCAYCSFVSAGVGRDGGLIAPFLAALLREIEAAGRLIAKHGLRVTTMYLGGGTPTTLSAAQLDALLAALFAAIPQGGCRERTVEAGRADTITADKLSVLRAHGINRISVNPQSMDDAVLRAIGRAHTAAQVQDAWALVRRAGFPIVNMDLIAGLPGDSAAGFGSSLNAVMALHPENITLHTLARKRGADMTRAVCGDAAAGSGSVAAMLDYALEALPKSGYAPYYLYRQKYMAGAFENVGWSLKGFESAYNICMMEELCPTLALGGGGVTKLVDRTTGGIVRLSNPKYPKEYIERIDAIIARKEGISWPIN